LRGKFIGARTREAEASGVDQCGRKYVTLFDGGELGMREILLRPVADDRAACETASAVGL